MLSRDCWGELGAKICLWGEMGLFLKDWSHFDSPEVPSLVAALLADDTQENIMSSNSPFPGVS